MKLSIYALFTFLIVLAFGNGYAQNQYDTQQLLWARYNLKVNINNSLEVKQEVEERSYWFPFRQHQFVSRTTLLKSLGKGLKSGFGAAYFEHTLPNDPEIKSTYHITEISPLFELDYSHKLSNKNTLSHRLRSEFRFLEEASGKIDFRTNRFRYKLEITHDLNSSFSLSAFDEFMINISGSNVPHVFDQNRLGASINYHISKNYGFELGYFNWLQPKANQGEYYSRHIARLTFHHIISIKEK